MNPDPEERRDYVYNQLDEYGRLYMNCLELFVHKLWCRQKMLFRNNKIYEEKLATISEVIGALTASDQVVAANKNESERLESTIHKINEIIYIPPPLDRNGLSLVNDLLIKEATDNFAKFHEPANYSGSLCDLTTEEGPLNLNLSSCNQSIANRIGGVIKASNSLPVTTTTTTTTTNNIPSATIPLSTHYHSLPNNSNTSASSLAPTSVTLTLSSSSTTTTPSVIKTNTSSSSSSSSSSSHHHHQQQSQQQHNHSHHHHHHHQSKLVKLHQHQNHHQSNGTTTNNESDKCPSNSKRKMESENESNNHHPMRFKMGRDFELHPEDESYVEEQITADSYEIEEDDEDDEEEEIEVDLSGNSMQSYLNTSEPIGASSNNKDLSHQRSSVLRRFRRPIVDSEIVKCCIQMGCRYLERQNANHMRKHYRSWHNDIAYPKNPYVKVDMTAEAITEHLEAWMLQRKNRQQRVTLKNSEVL